MRNGEIKTSIFQFFVSLSYFDEGLVLGTVHPRFFFITVLAHPPLVPHIENKVLVPSSHAELRNLSMQRETSVSWVGGTMSVTIHPFIHPIHVGGSN
jgi:hypothetical protein